MHPKFIGAAAVLALVTAACGSSDSGGPSFTTEMDSATMDMVASEAFDMAGSVFSDVFQNGQPSIPLGFAAASVAKASPTEFARAYLERARRMADLRDPGLAARVPAMAAPQFFAAFSECTPTETGVDELGDPIDSDADGVPDDYTVNFGSACVEEDSAGTYRLTYSGSVRMQDVSSGFYGFKVTLNHLKIKEENLNSGDSYAFALNGSETFDAAAALASHSTNWSYTISLTSGGTTNSYTLSDKETSSFDPDAGQNLALGSDLPDGVFTYNGDWRIVGENSGGEVPGNFRMVLSTTTPLHYTAVCGGPVSGVFRGLFSGNADVGFTATWDGCGDPTVDFFGYQNVVTVAAN